MENLKIAGITGWECAFLIASSPRGHRVDAISFINKPQIRNGRENALLRRRRPLTSKL